MRNGVTAHRGNSTDYPGNTIPAFKSAVSLGADWIELDIHRTKDGQIVVIHDASTGSIGDKDLVVSEVTYDELKSVDAAHCFRRAGSLTLTQCPPARIPLLSEVIRLIMQQTETRLSIQPKADCVAEAIAIINELKAGKRVGFNDGSLAMMKEVKEYDKSIPVFWDRSTDTNIDEDICIALEEGFESIVIEDAGITKEKIDKIHKAGLEAGAWTVNDTCRMKSLLLMGVDRIYTDNPGMLLQLLKKR